MKFLKRFEVWLIIMAVVASLVISCSGCARASDKPERKPPPEPSREISHYVLRTPLDYENVYVVEFRDSAGRVCVLALSGRHPMLSCARPLPPLNYEDLPPVEGEQQ